MKIETVMKSPRIMIACLAVIVTMSTFSPDATAQVKTGLDVLIAENFQPLAGKRIGLATNESGITRDGRRNIDIFLSQKNIKLTALFSMEHGIDGLRDDPHIENSTYKDTGI